MSVVCLFVPGKPWLLINMTSYGTYARTYFTVCRKKKSFIALVLFAHPTPVCRTSAVTGSHSLSLCLAHINSSSPAHHLHVKVSCTMNKLQKAILAEQLKSWLPVIVGWRSVSGHWKKNNDYDEYLWWINIWQRGYDLFPSSLGKGLEQSDLVSDLEVLIGLCEECWGEVAFLPELELL